MSRFLPGTGHVWIRHEYEGMNFWALGHAWIGDRFYDAEALAKNLAMAKADSSLEKFLHDLNGHFALVLEHADFLWAAVDRTRSIPLFYMPQKDGAFVSDSPKLLREHFPNFTFDQDSIKEFLACGYVSGSDTLLSGLRQLQAGESLLVQKDARLNLNNYFVYYGNLRQNISDEALIGEFDAILEKAFRRLVEFAKGRQMVIPLSGGLDSRLVASRLKKLGCTNVFCYAYGKPYSADVAKSRLIAERLGFPWEHVPYSAAIWHEVYRSPEWRKYYRFAHNFVSVPHMDEWPALMELKRRKLVSEESVFVPGHTGDFISGGHLCYFDNTPGELSQKKLEDSVIRKHYGLWPLPGNGELREFFRARIRTCLASCPQEAPEELAQGYEFWEWRERQAKYIINAVRSYEYHGFHWHLPLWDSEIVDFWRGIPPDSKRNKRLYKKFLTATDREGVFTELKGRENAVPARDKLSGNFLFGGVANSVREFKKFLSRYYAHPLGVWGICGYTETLTKYRSARNPVAILARDFGSLTGEDAWPF